MTDRSNWQTRKTTLSEQDQDNDLANATMEERVAMVWPLTVEAWAMKGEDVTRQQMRHDVVRIKRGERNLANLINHE